MITYGNMYFIGGKKKIKEKILLIQKIHTSLKTKKIEEVQVNLSDAEEEGLSDGDKVSGFKIKLEKSVLPSHFWFIMKNKDDSGKDSDILRK